MLLMCIRRIQTTPLARLHGFCVIRKNRIRILQEHYLRMQDRDLFMMQCWMEEMHGWIHY